MQEKRRDAMYFEYDLNDGIGQIYFYDGPKKMPLFNPQGHNINYLKQVISQFKDVAFLDPGDVIRNQEGVFHIRNIGSEDNLSRRVTVGNMAFKDAGEEMKVAIYDTGTEYNDLEDHMRDPKRVKFASTILRVAMVKNISELYLECEHGEGKRNVAIYHESDEGRKNLFPSRANAMDIDRNPCFVKTAMARFKRHANLNHLNDTEGQTGKFSIAYDAQHARYDPVRISTIIAPAQNVDVTLRTMPTETYEKMKLTFVATDREYVPL